MNIDNYIIIHLRHYRIIQVPIHIVCILIYSEYTKTKWSVNYTFGFGSKHNIVFHRITIDV